MFVATKIRFISHVFGCIFVENNRKPFTRVGLSPHLTFCVARVCVAVFFRLKQKTKTQRLGELRIIGGLEKKVVAKST